MKNKYVMNLHIFENDVNIIDRTGAESLIPVQESNEIIQGIITQSAVLQRGRKLPNMTSKQYKMPVLDMLPIAYFVNGDSGQKKTTKMAWDKKFIIAEEIAVIVPIPEAVLDDSEYDIWAETKPRIIEAFGKKIDGAILFGDDKPASWRADVVTTANTAKSVVTLGAGDNLYDKIMGEEGSIALIENSGYFVNGHMADISMRAKLRGLKNANNFSSIHDRIVWSIQFTFPLVMGIWAIIRNMSTVIICSNGYILCKYQIICRHVRIHEFCCLIRQKQHIIPPVNLFFCNLPGGFLPVKFYLHTLSSQAVMLRNRKLRIICRCSHFKSVRLITVQNLSDSLSGNSCDFFCAFTVNHDISL